MAPLTAGGVGAEKIGQGCPDPMPNFFHAPPIHKKVGVLTNAPSADAPR